MRAEDLRAGTAYAVAERFTRGSRPGDPGLIWFELESTTPRVSALGKADMRLFPGQTSDGVPRDVQSRQIVCTWDDHALALSPEDTRRQERDKATREEAAGMYGRIAAAVNSKAEMEMINASLPEGIRSRKQRLVSFTLADLDEIVSAVRAQAFYEACDHALKHRDVGRPRRGAQWALGVEDAARVIRGQIR